MTKTELETVIEAYELMRYNGIEESQWDGVAIKLFDAALAILQAELTRPEPVAKDAACCLCSSSLPNNLPKRSR